MTYSHAKVSTLGKTSAKLLATALAATTLLMAAAPAEARDWHGNDGWRGNNGWHGNNNNWNHHDGWRGHDRSRVSFNYGYSSYNPGYYRPAPVYYAPAPVYYRPDPVYYRPAPVYYRPAPVYYQQPYYSPSYSSISFSYGR